MLPDVMHCGPRDRKRNTDDHLHFLHAGISSDSPLTKMVGSGYPIRMPSFVALMVVSTPLSCTTLQIGVDVLLGPLN